MTDVTSGGAPATSADPADLAGPTCLHADALRVLGRWHAPGEVQDSLRRRYVDHLDAHADGMRRSCFPEHVTASVLILSADGQQVLLTLHAKANAWFQMGGHCEEVDHTLAAAAMREAVEESGVDGLVLDPLPLQLDAHAVSFCDPRGTVTHLDVRLLAIAPVNARHAVSEESLEVRWFPADALPTDDPRMHELVRLARERLARGVGTPLA